MPLTTGLVISLLLIGFAIGTVGGMIGIAGGVIIIPVLMFGFGFSQRLATGTSLAMLLPPTGIFAAMVYARSGNVSWSFAMLLATGFVAGAFIGATVVNRGWINASSLRIFFALFLIYVAANMLFRRGSAQRAALEASLLVAGFGAIYLLLRFVGRRVGTTRSFSDTYRDRLENALPYDYKI